MKKLVLAILAAGSVVSAQAQKPGSILVYGSGSVEASKNTFDDGFPGTSDDESKSMMWHVMPGVGYQFNKNWTVGIQFGIGGNKNVAEQQVGTDLMGNPIFADVTNRTRNLEVGPFVRYTVPINKTFFVFKQLNLSYLNEKNTVEIPNAPDVEVTSSGFGASIMPAVGVNFTRCMALNFGFGGLGFSTMKTDLAGSAENRVTDFAVTFGQQFHFGVSANLGGRKMRGHSEPGMDHRKMNAYDDEEDDMPKRKKKSSDDDDE